MKKSASICFFLFLSFSLYAQKDKPSFPIHEIEFSLNRADVSGENTENRLGVGVGVYHSFFKPKRLNIITGLEYNLTNQFKNYLYLGHYAHATDVNYSIRTLSLPVSVRYNIGNKIKYFVQGGGYIDFYTKTRERGTFHSNGSIDDVIVHEESIYDNKGGLPNFYGVCLGGGIMLPIGTIESKIRLSYKLPLRYYSGNYNIYNSYFKLSIGFSI